VPSCLLWNFWTEGNRWAFEGNGQSMLEIKMNISGPSYIGFHSSFYTVLCQFLGFINVRFWKCNPKGLPQVVRALVFVVVYKV
jgi:hypothetical protein